MYGAKKLFFLHFAVFALSVRYLAKKIIILRFFICFHVILYSKSAPEGALFVYAAISALPEDVVCDSIFSMSMP